MRSATAFLAVMASLAFWGCGPSLRGAPATASHPTAPRLAVLPALWITPSPQCALDATKAALDGLSDSHAVEPVRAELPPAAPGAAPSPACQEDPGCVRRAGAASRAQKAIVIKLAELGDTVLTRISLVDVEGGTHELTRQQAVRAQPALVAQAVRSMTLELGRSLGPEPTAPSPAWYERWWVWAGVGVVVASAIAVPLLIRNSQETKNGPDVVITPP
jgi:hypothetical protein